MGASVSPGSRRRSHRRRWNSPTAPDKWVQPLTSIFFSAIFAETFQQVAADQFFCSPTQSCCIGGVGHLLQWWLDVDHLKAVNGHPHQHVVHGDMSCCGCRRRADSRGPFAVGEARFDVIQTIGATVTFVTHATQMQALAGGRGRQRHGKQVAGGKSSWRRCRL